MFELQVNQRVFADSVRQAVDAWLASSREPRRANVRVEGDRVVVEVLVDSATSTTADASTQVYFFEPSTGGISVTRVTTVEEAEAAAAPAATRLDPALLELLFERLARSEGLITGKTTPLESK